MNAMKENTEIRNEMGAALAIAAVMMILLLSFGALAVDLGMNYLERHHLQVATDVGSIAGVREMVSNSAATIDTVKAAATAVAIENGMTAAELSAQNGVEVGVWDSNTSQFTPGSSSGALTNQNAVRVSGQRTVDTFFGGIMGVNTISPTAVGTASTESPTTAVCLVPFGIEPLYVEDLNVGDQFTIAARDVQQGRGGSGNWGKLNMSGDMHGKNAFIDAMTGMTGCNYPQQIGDMIETEPGYAGVDDGLNAMGNVKFPLAVVDAFRNGRKDVQLLGFVMAKFVGSTGNGNNWEGTFQLEDRLVGSGAGGPGTYNEKSVVLVE